MRRKIRANSKMQVYPGITLSAVGNSPTLIPYNSISFTVGQLVGQPITSLGLACTISPGAVLTYSVQVSGDPPNSVTNWIDHDVLFNMTDNRYGQIAYPISALRLIVTAWTSGSVNLGVVQWP